MHSELQLEFFKVFSSSYNGKRDSTFSLFPFKPWREIKVHRDTFPLILPYANRDPTLDCRAMGRGDPGSSWLCGNREEREEEEEGTGSRRSEV